MFKCIIILITNAIFINLNRLVFLFKIARHQPLFIVVTYEAVYITNEEVPISQLYYYHHVVGSKYRREVYNSI